MHASPAYDWLSLRGMKADFDLDEIGPVYPWLLFSPLAFPASGRAPSNRGVGSTTSSGGMGSAAVAPRSLNRRMPGRSLVSKDPTALLKALTAAVKAPRKDSRCSQRTEARSYTCFPRLLIS